MFTQILPITLIILGYLLQLSKFQQAHFEYNQNSRSPRRKRLTGGTDTSIENFPYMVLIIYNYS